MIRLFCKCVIAFVISLSICSGEDLHSYRPEAGFVSSEATALAIAEAILFPIYGKDSIEAQKPFKVTLKDGVWTVEGRVPTTAGKINVGGSAKIRISKMTGEILQVTHTK